MAGRFQGKVAIITGGGRGIGRETAILLGREGAKVVVNDLGGAVGGGGADPGIAQQVVDEIVAAGGVAIANPADVASFEGARSVVDAAISNFGRVDILFNGAGILRHGLIHEMTEDTWDQVLRVNLKSAYAMCHHVAPHMMRQREGSIICASSPSGFGHYGMSAYAATKEALVAFTRSIARELGEYGIRCNIIRPCAETRMLVQEILDDVDYSVNELGIPPIGEQWFPGLNGEEPACVTDNVAATIAWLCLPATAALNGRTLYIAGGHLALCADPELLRSRYNASGWDLDTLLSDPVVAHFTYGQRNHFARQGAKAKSLMESSKA